MSKVKCKLCNCEGVDGALLCREHLEGFQFAQKLLRSTNDLKQHMKIDAIADVLSRLIEQPAKEAEGNGKNK